MNNAKMHRGQKILAMAIVAMFAMCAFSVCLAADSNAENNDGATYYINARVGDGFTYHPEANLPGTTFSITPTVGGLKWANDTLATETGGFTTENKTGTTETIMANWTSSDDPTLSQTATQNIVFTVYNKIKFDSKADEESIGILKSGNSTSTPLKTVNITADSPDETRWGTPTFSNNGGSFFDVTANGKQLTITPKVSTITAGTYTIEIDASYSFVPNKNGGNTIADSRTYTYTIVVAEDVAITAQHLYAYVGESSNKAFTIEVTNKDGVTTLVPTLDATSDVYADVADKADHDIQLTLDATHSTFDGITENSQDFELTVTATGNKTVNGVKNTYTATQKLDLTVYANLAFTTTPSITGTTNSYVSSGDSMNVLVTNTILGAKKLVYNWGDGKVETKVVNGAENTFYTNDHTYAKPGMYTITVTAYNDFGNRATYTMFQAGETEGETPAAGEDDKTPGTGSEKKSLIDEHGYQFIIFAILAIVALIAYFYFGFQNPLVIVFALIMAILAVCSYVYCDISGIIDEIKGLLNKN